MNLEVIILGISSVVFFQSIGKVLKLYLEKRGEHTANLRYGDQTITVDLESPDQAELFLKNFLSRHPDDEEKTTK